MFNLEKFLQDANLINDQISYTHYIYSRKENFVFSACAVSDNFMKYHASYYNPHIASLTRLSCIFF